MYDRLLLHMLVEQKSARPSIHPSVHASIRPHGEADADIGVHSVVIPICAVVVNSNIENRTE